MNYFTFFSGFLKPFDISIFFKKRKIHHALFPLIILFFGISLENIHGQTTLLDEDFDAYPTGDVTSTVSTDMYQFDGIACSNDIWDVVSTSHSGNISCSNCSGRWAEIYYDNCDQDETLVSKQFIPNTASFDISFDYRFNWYSAGDNFNVVLYNETDGAIVSTLLNLSTDDLGPDYGPTTATISGANAVTDAYSLRFNYVGNGGWGASVDNLLVIGNCSSPAATYTTNTTNCGAGTFNIDVNVTALGDGTGVDISDGTTTFETNVGTGNYSIGPFAAGANVIVNVNGANYGGCSTVSSSLTEACECAMIPVATVNSTTPNCGAGTFDIEVTVTNFGSGTNADIYVDGALEASNVGMTMQTINKPIGSYTITVEATGGSGYASCTSIDYAASAACTNYTCATAFDVAVNGAAVSTTPVPNSSTSGEPGGGCDNFGNEDNWFMFTAPSSGLISLAVTNISSGTPEVVLYSGTCGSLTEVDCNSSVNGFSATGLTGGNTYFLQIFYDSGSGQTYDVAITNPVPDLTANVEGCATIGDLDGGTFDLGDSGDDYACGFGGSYGSNCCDYQAAFTYTATATGNISVNVSGIATPTNSGDFANGAAAAVFNATDATPANCLGGTSVSGNQDIEISGISVVSGQSYLIIVGSPNGSSDLNNEVCATVSLECATTYTTSVVDNCGAGTYAGTVNFSNLGSVASSVSISDGTTSYSNISTGTDYVFNFTDVLAHTVTITGMSSSCGEAFTFSSGCNGGDICSQAVDILGISSICNLTVANNNSNETDEHADENSITMGNGNILSNCSSGPQHSAYWYSDYADLWYVIDIPDGADEFTVTFTGLTCPVAVLPYTGSCGSLSLMSITGGVGTGLADADNNGVVETAANDNPLINTDGVIHFKGTEVATASTAPIYLRIVPHDDKASGTNCNPADIVPCSFTISASSPQANDVCGDAIDIDGVSATGNLCLASAETENSETGTTCSESSDTKDLWYKVEMDAGDPNQFLTVDLTFTNASDAVVVELHHSCNTNSYEECATITSTGANSTVSHKFTEEITAGGFGPEWYVRVVPSSGNSVCDFSIQGQRAAVNDDCDYFNQVTTNFRLYDNTNPVTNNADFNFATSDDLWYIFNSEGSFNGYSGSVDFTVSGIGSGEALTFEVYERTPLYNTDCNALVQAGSSVSFTSDGTKTLDCLNQLEADYLVRVTSTGGTTAIVDISAQPSDGAPVNDECAIIYDGSITSAGSPFDLTDATLSGQTFTNARACAGLANTCGSEDSDKDLWYYITIPSSSCNPPSALGDLASSDKITSVTLSYDAGTDVGRKAWVYVYSDCNTSVDCFSVDGTGTGSSGTVNNLTPGTTYLVRVVPSSLNSNNTGWSFSMTGALGVGRPCNDLAENAYEIDFNPHGTGLNLSTLSAYAIDGATNSGDGDLKPDVWFYFDMPATANGQDYPVSVSSGPSFGQGYIQGIGAGVGKMTLYHSQDDGNGGFEKGGTVTTAETGSASDPFHGFVDNGSGEKGWGNLEPGKRYYLRVSTSLTNPLPPAPSNALNKSVVTSNNTYKVGVYGPGLSDVGSNTAVLGCNTSPVSTSTSATTVLGCDICEFQYRIQPPSNGISSYYRIAVTLNNPGNWSMPMMSVQGKGGETSNEGSTEDYNNPCQNVGNIAPTSSATDFDKVYNFNGGSDALPEWQFLEIWSADFGNEMCDGGLTVDFYGPYYDAATAATGTDKGCGEITGTIFIDNLADGLSSNLLGYGTDVGLAGATVRLYAADGTLIGTTTSDSNGNYSFPGLPDDTQWYIEVTPPAGYQSTVQDYGGANDGIDSDVAKGMGAQRTGDFSITRNSTTGDVSGGFYQLGTITGTLYSDNFSTGAPNQSATITVTYLLPDGSSTTVDYPITTDGSGNYTINSVVPGRITNISSSYGANDGSAVVGGSGGGPANYDGTSGFSLTAQDFGNVSPILPVELTDFEGFVATKVNNLTWKTASEINTKKFIIERSVGGSSDWTALGEVAANGNSETTLTYSFVDELPLRLSYYRLKIVDFNGSIEFSKVIFLQRTQTGIEITNIFPIPTRKEITVEFFNAKAGQVQLMLTDMFGKTIYVDTQEVIAGNVSLTLSLADYPTGMYFLSMDDGVQQEIRKIVKD